MKIIAGKVVRTGCHRATDVTDAVGLSDIFKSRLRTAVPLGRR